MKRPRTPPPYEHRTNSVARWSACNRSANSVPTFPTAFIKRGPVYFLPGLLDCSEHSVSQNMPKCKNADTRATAVRNRKRSYQKNISPHALGELQDYNERPFPPIHSIGKMDTMCSSCGAYMWKAELHSGCLGVNAKFSTCCMQGTHVVQLLGKTTPSADSVRTESQVPTRIRRFQQR